MPKAKLIFVVSSIIIIVLLLVYKLSTHALNQTRPGKAEIIEQEQSSDDASDGPANELTKNSAKPAPEAHTQVEIEASQDILVCGIEPQQQDEAYHVMVADYLNALDNAVMYEQKLAYTLFGDYQTLANEADRFPLLINFDKSFPQTPLVLMDALNICATSLRPECTDEFVEYAISADYQNGAMWFNAALLHASKGNDDGVFEMIAGIEKANVFNERRGERITVFVDALSASPASHFARNLMHGLGIEAARTLGFAPITNWCKEGANEVQKASACLSLGRNMESRGKEAIFKLIGIAIQRFVYEAEQNFEAIEQLEQRSTSIRNMYEPDDSAKTFDLLMNDEKRMRQWLVNIDSMGESAATQALIDEARKVSRYIGQAYCGK
ncbi:hypothetical protein KJ365_03220 [Glaciecola sp. XM2]|uniref:hypothetical protein n=1 Tax=Glaciecola sp. XM2 TaxID=1914931 RepID=UPI001BDE0537|nr:hypothetical protein [Glaciecola sp. XM2]MBT1449878.1 hypothetical protein [Glaciecola sp. XM2]